MLNINFTPFPVLVTERLILRQLQIFDANEIFVLRSNEIVNQYISRPKTITVQEACEFIRQINNNIAKNEWIYWAITLRPKPELIGTICYWNIVKEKSTAEIGYELHPYFKQKGIMQEAITSVIKYGFQTMRLKTTEAYTNSANEKSIKLLEKNNFREKIDSQNHIKNEEVSFSLTNIEKNNNVE